MSLHRIHRQLKNSKYPTPPTTRHQTRLTRLKSFRGQKGKEHTSAGNRRTNQVHVSAPPHPQKQTGERSLRSALLALLSFHTPDRQVVIQKVGLRRWILTDDGLLILENRPEFALSVAGPIDAGAENWSTWLVRSGRTLPEKGAIQG